MSGPTRFVIRDEVTQHDTDDWHLCLQRGTLHMPDEHQDGYRFIWRRPDGSLQAARAQARLPSLRLARELMAAADAAGWGHFEADEATRSFDTRPSDEPETVEDEQSSPVVPTNELPFEERITSSVHSTRLRVANLESRLSEIEARFPNLVDHDA